MLNETNVRYYRRHRFLSNEYNIADRLPCNGKAANQTNEKLICSYLNYKQRIKETLIEKARETCGIKKVKEDKLVDQLSETQN